MASVEILARIPDQSTDRIYSTLCDFERYAELTSAVRSVSIESNNGVTLSTWETNFREGILRWKEQDYFDPVARTIAFVQIEGDVEHFSGKWEVSPLSHGGLVSFSAQFDMGIPSLSKVLDPIAEQALRENIIVIIKGLFGQNAEILSDGLLVIQEAANF